MDEILNYFGLNSSKSTLENYSLFQKILFAVMIGPFFETLLTQAFLINFFMIFREKLSLSFSENWILIIVGIIFSLWHYNGTFELCIFTLFGGLFFAWYYNFIRIKSGNKIAFLSTTFIHSFWNLLLIVLSVLSSE